MLKCSICNREFKDSQLDEYAAHVQKCVSEESIKRKTEDMKKINQELTELKKLKVLYEKTRDNFKEKYPDIYKSNFTDECNGECKCRSNDSKKTPNERSISLANTPLKKPINKGKLETDNSDKSDSIVHNDYYGFDVDFSDLRRAIDKMFGLDLLKN